MEKKKNKKKKGNLLPERHGQPGQREREMVILLCVSLISSEEKKEEGSLFFLLFVVYVVVASSWRRHKRRSPDRSALSLLGHPTVPFARPNPPVPVATAAAISTRKKKREIHFISCSMLGSSCSLFFFFRKSNSDPKNGPTKIWISNENPNVGGVTFAILLYWIIQQCLLQKMEFNICIQSCLLLCVPIDLSYRLSRCSFSRGGGYIVLLAFFFSLEDRWNLCLAKKRRIFYKVTKAADTM